MKNLYDAMADLEHTLTTIVMQAKCFDNMDISVASATCNLEDFLKTRDAILWRMSQEYYSAPKPGLRLVEGEEMRKQARG